MQIMFLLATAPIHAQNPPTETLLTHKESDCKLYHPIGAAVIEAQLLNVVGNCVGGYFQGVVIYGVGTSHHITNGPSKKIVGVRTGFMEQGRFEGLRMQLNEYGFIILSKPDRSSAYSNQKGQAEYSLAQLLDVIKTEAPKAGGASASANRDHLTTIATRWDSNFKGMISAYTQDTSNPRVAIANNIPAVTTQASTNQDDPKVLGRSMRGGG